MKTIECMICPAIACAKGLCKTHYQKEYYKQHGDRIRAARAAKRRNPEYRQKEADRKRREYWANPERERERCRHNQRTRTGSASSPRTAPNLEAGRLATKRYWANHPERRRANRVARRAQERKAPGVAPASAIAARVAYYGSTCYLCRSAPYEHLDHVIPLSRGGSNWPANIRPACASCNVRKGNKSLNEFQRITTQATG